MTDLNKEDFFRLMGTDERNAVAKAIWDTLEFNGYCITHVPEGSKIIAGLRIKNAGEVATGVKEGMEGYFAWFKIGVQTFQLADQETKELAVWYQDQLNTALKSLKGPNLKSVSDMTGADWMAMKNNLSPHVVYSAIQKGHKRVLENRIVTNTLLYNDGLVLVANGFDPNKI